MSDPQARPLYSTLELGATSVESYSMRRATSQKLQAAAIGIGLVGTVAVSKFAPLPYRDLVVPLGLAFGIWGVCFGLMRLRDWWDTQGQ